MAVYGAIKNTPKQIWNYTILFGFPQTKGKIH